MAALDSWTTVKTALLVAIAVGAVHAASGNAEDLARFRAAQLMKDRQDLDGAIHAFTQAIVLDKLSPANMAAAFNNRGNAWFTKREFDRAIADYTDALGIDKRYAPTYDNRGSAYMAKGNVSQAIEDYTRAIQYEPGRVSAFNSRGAAFITLRQFDQAFEDFNQALRLDPKSALAHHGRGRVLSVQREHSKASEAFTRAIALNPNLVDAYNFRGTARFEMGAFAPAVEDFSQALRLNPQQVFTYEQRGVAHYFLGDMPSAAADFAHTLQLAPARLQAMLWEYLAHANSKTEAVATLTRRTQGMDLAASPAIQVFLHKVDPEEAIRRAESGDPKTRRDRLCGLSFWVGKWYSSRAEREPAIRRLREATQFCDGGYAEYTAARHALAALKQSEH